MQMILALLSAAACIALGTLAARRLTQRERALKQWEDAFFRMEGAVAGGGESLTEVLLAGAGEQVGALRQAAEMLQASPAIDGRALAQQMNPDTVLTGMEKETIAECMAALFSPSREAQLNALARARTQWTLFCKAGQANREKYGRLYVSLGWLAGAALFILMC